MNAMAKAVDILGIDQLRRLADAGLAVVEKRRLEMLERIYDAEKRLSRYHHTKSEWKTANMDLVVALRELERIELMTTEENGLGQTEKAGEANGTDHRG